MEGKDMLLAAGIVVAAFVSAFIFWEPAGLRLWQRQSKIAGLHNFGKTCSLNTLLQAFAACPLFIAWLRECSDAAQDKKGLVSTLLHTLETINGAESYFRGDTYTPSAVLHGLTALGWDISQEGHDAHELFHMLIASIEDVAIHAEPLGNPSLETLLVHDSVMVNAGPVPDGKASSSLACLIHTELPAASYVQTVRGVKRDMADSIAATVARMARKAATTILESMSLSLQPTTRISQRRIGARGHATTPRFASSHALVTAAERTDLSQQYMHPFQGAMSNQIVCHACGHRSAMRYEEFDSVTLNLPTERHDAINLSDLLSKHIAAEHLSDVTCGACHETATHTKTLKFAELPACLCIHIARTVWLPTGQICKRHDHVRFPESLWMSPYCILQTQLHLHDGSTTPLQSHHQSHKKENSFGKMFPRNFYRLLAVVMHSGGANTGHFVTYRRGAATQAQTWFYTSDRIVREVSFEEVLHVPAYLLFYDRRL